MVLQMRKIARRYSKNVRWKQFKEGDLVWKLVLPVGPKDHVFGKWSAN